MNPESPDFVSKPADKLGNKVTNCLYLFVFDWGFCLIVMFILLSELCAVPTAQLALVHALTGVLQGIMVLAQTGPVPGSYSCTSALIQATLRTTFTLPMSYRLMLCSYDLTPVPWDFPKALKTHPSSKTVTDRCIHRLAARQLGAYQYSRYSIERLAPQTSLFAPTSLSPKCYT